MPLSLLTLNCEEDKHLDRILPFLKQHQYDVICLQEVFEKDLAELASAAEAQAFYSPLALLAGKVWGIAVLVRKTISDVHLFQKYYRGNSQNLPTFDHHSPNGVNRAVINIKFEEYSITTTHFTWAGGGGTDPVQFEDFPNLKNILAEIGETVFCGDLNSPRGISPIFTELAQLYTDNIPPEITTTIDGSLHRAGNLQLVVDGFFSSAHYEIRDVKILTGLSDHCGIQGQVYLKP